MKYKVNLFFDDEAQPVKEVLEDILKSYFNEVEYHEIWYNRDMQKNKFFVR